MLKTRIQEHQSALTIGDPNSQIYQHALETDHSIILIPRNFQKNASYDF